MAVRTALVTGAASGMGQLSAWRLAAAGATVVAVDVDGEGLSRTARRASGIVTRVVDIGDPGAVQRLAAEVTGEFGTPDRVVNAAAIAPTARLADQPVDVVLRLMEVNYGGLVSVTKAFLGPMLERRAGELVQFGSLAGWLPTPYFGAYSATKAAVVAFCETLHHELAGSGVRQVCVCPPVVDTPLLDQVVEAPAAFARVPRLRPEVVLDDVERALAAGRCFSFPGRGTTALWRLRRLAPELLWRRVDALS